MRVKVLVTHVSMEPDDDLEGYHGECLLRLPLGLGAQVLGGLVGMEVELDLESTLATQPDPQILKIVPARPRRGRGRKDV